MKHSMDNYHLFELDAITEFVLSHNAKKVALQFPDNLLFKSFEISRVLADRAKCQTFVLADTAYSSCCVDEVAASRIDADLLIHFGEACHSPVGRINVEYVHIRKPIDIDDVVGKISCSPLTNMKSFIIFYELCYEHAIVDIQKHLLETLRTSDSSCSFTVASIKELIEPNYFDETETSENSENNKELETSSNLHRLCLPERSSVQNVSILFIGAESQLLKSVSLRYNLDEIFLYDPDPSSKNNSEVVCLESERNRILKRHYYLIGQVESSSSIGIIVATLSVGKYLDVINYLKHLIKESGRKCYVLSVGKINECKLGNFTGINTFVIVGCTLSSLVDLDHSINVLTPFDLEIALSRTREWTGDYTTNFREILPNRESEEKEGDLSKGKRNPSSSKELQSFSENAITKRNEEFNLVDQQKVFDGLEPRIGETPVAKLVEGLSGIATSYKQTDQ